MNKFNRMGRERKKCCKKERELQPNAPFQNDDATEELIQMEFLERERDRQTEQEKKKHTKSTPRTY